jgi:hypothetical protein
MDLEVVASERREAPPRLPPAGWLVERDKVTISISALLSNRKVFARRRRVDELTPHLQPRRRVWRSTSREEVRPRGVRSGADKGE